MNAAEVPGDWRPCKVCLRPRPPSAYRAFPRGPGGKVYPSRTCMLCEAIRRRERRKARGPGRHAPQPGDRHRDTPIRRLLKKRTHHRARLKQIEEQIRWLRGQVGRAGE